MSKIAIDIVLLPPDEIMDVCIEISEKSAQANYAGFILDKADYIPHISLLMGVAKEADLPLIYKTFNDTISKHKALELELTKLYGKTRPDSTSSFGFEIKKTPELQALHENLTTQISPILQKEKAKLDYFFKKPDETIEPVSSFWVDKYDKTCFENFYPHLTLKTSFAKYSSTLPIKFTNQRIAICHLGTLCTCRKILYETKLS